MIKIFLKFIKEHIRQSTQYLFLIIIANVCIIYQPLLLGNVLSQSSFHFDLQILMFLTLSVITPLVTSYKDRTLNYVTNLMSVDVANNMVNDILHKDILEVKKKTPNFIIRVINNFSWLISAFYLYTFLYTIISLISATIMLFLLSKSNLYLSAFIFMSHLLRLLMIYFVQKKIMNSVEKKIKSENLFFSTLTSYITKLKTIITRSKFKESRQVLEKQMSNHLLSVKSLSVYRSLSSSLGEAGFWLIRFATLLLGLYLSKTIGVTLATLQLAFSYSNEIGSCMQMVSEFMPTYSELKANYTEIQALYRIEDIKRDGYENKFDKIQVRNLEFGYDDNLVLNGINVEMKIGNVYVVKGENGRGKSTFIKIISGIYANYHGEILLNNISLKDYNKEYYFDHLITILTQDDLLFEGTIKDNLLSEDELFLSKVCEYINIGNLERHVLVNGENLSGGEKRKILLARALLDIKRKNPSLVIFDEPTYAIEADLISKIVNIINQVSKKCIVIVISHDDLPFENKVEIDL